MTNPITVTADGVMYQRGNKLDAIPLNGAFFQLNDVYRWANNSELIWWFDDEWVTSIQPVSKFIKIYEARPIDTPKAPEWVRVGSNENYNVTWQKPYHLERTTENTIEYILSAPRVKIEWLSGAAEYEKQEGCWYYIGGDGGCLYPHDMEQAIGYALDHKLPVYVMEGDV